MIYENQEIPCPVCRAKIPFDTRQLVKGVRFTCPSCFAQIGLAPESKPIVEDALQQFDELKQKCDEIN